MTRLKAIVDPSGDHAGNWSRSGPMVSCRSWSAFEVADEQIGVGQVALGHAPGCTPDRSAGVRMSSGGSVVVVVADRAARGRTGSPVDGGVGPWPVVLVVGPVVVVDEGSDPGTVGGVVPGAPVVVVVVVGSRPAAMTSGSSPGGSLSGCPDPFPAASDPVPAGDDDPPGWSSVDSPAEAPSADGPSAREATSPATRTVVASSSADAHHTPLTSTTTASAAYPIRGRLLNSRLLARHGRARNRRPALLVGGVRGRLADLLRLVRSPAGACHRSERELSAHGQEPPRSGRTFR